MGLALPWSVRRDVSRVLFLPKARLVYLANPKTATQSIRAVLRPLSLREPPFGELHSRHLPFPGFDKRWRAQVEAVTGGPVEVLAVMREPFSRLESWFRYRHKNPEGAPNSTVGMSFDAFAREAAKGDAAADYARVGDQSRFCGWDGAQAGVDHLFDYDRMDLLVAFLQARLGIVVDLPQHNVSPTREDLSVTGLSAGAEAAYRASRPGEFSLWDALSAKGYLRR